MKKLLVVVDYQNDFIDGSLGFEGAKEIEPNIISLIKKFEQDNSDLVFTFDEHGDDYFDTVEGEKLPIKHCIKNTKGWEISEGLKPYLKNYPTFFKGSFGSDKLAAYAKINNYDEIYLCGLVSDICVFCNAVALKTFVSSKTKIFVYKDAVASNDLTSQQRCFEVLKHLHIEII